MVDHTAVRPGRPVAGEQDILLATKLHVPSPRPDRVPRPRLMELLNEQPLRGLVLVCAPAGYGKTVLLAEWARRGRRRPAWLSLDVGDNDPARFWRHMLAAIDQVRPGTDLRFGASSPQTSRSLEVPATALINELAAEAGDVDVLLVLDDYHVIDAPAVHELIDFLLEHRPPNLHLVLASRADPPLALARLRARDELTELRVAELRFTAEEAAALLQRPATSLDAGLPDDAVATLAARTEGWAAGLQLAALSLRGHPDAAGFITAFTGSHRHILDYLSEEVLERQSEDVRSFLGQTSVLERLSSSLCDAITGRSDSQAMLEQIERAGLFLVPLDEVRGWWRYHHLFADLLRARMEQDADRTVALHRAAAAWYEQVGLADESIHHTLAAGDKLSAARLIEAHFDTVFNLRGEEATIQRWLPALPAHLVRSRPRLLLAQAQMAAMRGDVDTMAPLIDAAEQAYERAGDEPFEPTAGKAASLLVNIPAVIALQRSYLAQLRDDPDGTATYTARARALVSDDEPTLSTAVQGFLGMDAWLRGHLSEAEHAFASRSAGWHSAGVALTNTAWRYYSLARIQRAQGNLDASDQTCRKALDYTGGPGRRLLPAAGPAFIGLAAVAYQCNDLGSAIGYLDDGIPLCRQFVHSPPLAAGLVTLAWVRSATGDAYGAREVVAEAEALAPGPLGLLNPVPAEAARLRLAHGDLVAAARWVERSGLRVEGDLAYPDELGHLVLARVLLAHGRRREAVALLDRLHAAALDQHRTGSLLEICALQALALDAEGEEQAALDALAQALRLAAPQGQIRVFTDEGTSMATLLTRLIAAERSGRAATSIPFGYLARVQRSFTGPQPSEAAGARAAPPADPLTAREREVLELMTAGMSNPAIAAQLVVSIDTVKKHVSHILDKLGASNRTEAVTRGRDMGISHLARTRP